MHANEQSAVRQAAVIFVLLFMAILFSAKVAFRSSQRIQKEVNFSCKEIRACFLYVQSDTEID